MIDDGSSDRTPQVVESLSNHQIRLIRQANSGQSAAINRGFSECSGDYIKILDADDCLNPDHISAQLAVLRGHEDCVASCRWGYFSDNPERLQTHQEYSQQDYSDPLEWLVDSLTKDEGMMGGWMWLIPRRIWARAGGWDEGLSLNNDFDFSIRLLLASKGVRFASEAVYSYRKGVPGALSGTGGRTAMESAFRTTESGCRHLLQRESSARIKQICANRWQQWLHVFYPEYPDLAAEAEKEVIALGGSTARLQGGSVLRCLLPLLGWKRIRRLQVASRILGWNTVLRWKARYRLKRIQVPDVRTL